MDFGILYKIGSVIYTIVNSIEEYLSSISIKRKLLID